MNFNHINVPSIDLQRIPVNLVINQTYVIDTVSSSLPFN
jgi:hypothetical protein